MLKVNTAWSTTPLENGHAGITWIVYSVKYYWTKSFKMKKSLDTLFLTVEQE